MMINLIEQINQTTQSFSFNFIKIKLYKMKLLYLLLTVMLFSLNDSKLISDSYLRTHPEEIAINFPKGRIINCLTKCPSSGCNCFRISQNTESTDCEYDVTGSTANNDKFIYYAIDRYNVTLTKGKNLANPSKAIQSKLLNKKDDNSKDEGAKDGQDSGFPWIQFDLEKEFVVTGIKIKSNKEWKNYEVRVGSSKIDETYSTKLFEANPLCSKKESSKESWKEVEVVPCKPCPLVGHYVQIQKVGNGDYYLSANDVSIHGFQPEK